MTTTRTFAFLLWPLGAVCAVGVLMVILRWAYTPGRSLVQRQVQPGAPDQYGLLTEVARPATYIEGEQQRLTLAAAGIRATLAPTTAGPRLMVFPQDASVAKALLRNPP